MSRFLRGVSGGLIVLMVGLMLACSGGDDDGEGGDGSSAGSGGSGSSSRALFDPKKADDLAHKALIAQSDLPGSGWEITSQDEFDDEDDPEFDELLRTEPACRDLRDLEALGSVLGGLESVSGRAQIGLEKDTGAIALPLSVEQDIVIEETTAGVSDVWGDVKGFIESSGTMNCMIAVFKKAFTSAADDSEIPISATLEPMTPLATAPQNGAVMAFRMKISVPQLFSFDGLMHMYLWPYSNAGVTVMFLGDPKEMTASFVQETLKKMDEKVVNAAK